MRAICLVRLFAPPMCPDKTDTMYLPVLSIFTMAGSVCLSVINGAMERTQIPNDPTNTNASNLLKCSFKKVAMDGIVSVNIDSKLEYRFDPGRCFAIVRESWRLLYETTSMAIPVFIRIILLSGCPLS